MSRTERLLKHLESGKSVTGKIAMDRFGLYRLSEYIRRFRKMGYHIVTEKVTRGGVQYARYFVNYKNEKRR